MSENILKLLSEATNGNRCAIVRYGNQNYIRVVEPHVIYSEEDGTLLADCYQVRGHSRSMSKQGFWKTFELAKINSVFLMGNPFKVRAREGFMPNQPKYLNNLIAMARRPVKQKTPAANQQTSRVIYQQARKLWWDMGNTIDKVLSDRDWGPKNR